jgi:ribosomal protein S6--L-glutamate ligase
MLIFIVSNSVNLYSTTRLKDSCDALGHDVKIMSPKQITNIKKGELSGSVVLNRVSGITYRDDDLEFYNKLGSTLIINNPIDTKLFRDKAKQYNFFQENKIPMIKTLDIENSNNDKLDVFLKKVKSESYLIKPKRSNQAKGIRVLSTAQVKDIKLEQMSDKRYILQPLLAKEREYRVLIINKKVISILKKSSENPYELLNCEKAKLDIVNKEKADPELDRIVSMAIKKINLFIMALDILVDTQGNYKLIEVNNIPGLKYVENITKLDIAKTIIEESINLARMQEA